METSNPCGLLFSTGGESPNLPGLDLSWLWGRDFEEDYSFSVCFLLPLPPERSYSVRRTYLKIKRCAFFVYGNLRNFHCMQRQHSGLHVYVRGAAVYLCAKVFLRYLTYK